MATKVVILKSSDIAVQALQLAGVLPPTVTLDLPTDEGGRSKKADIHEAYKQLIKDAKAGVFADDDEAENEPVNVEAPEAPVAAEPEAETEEG